MVVIFLLDFDRNNEIFIKLLIKTLGKIDSLLLLIITQRRTPDNEYEYILIA